MIISLLYVPLRVMSTKSLNCLLLVLCIFLFSFFFFRSSEKEMKIVIKLQFVNRRYQLTESNVLIFLQDLLQLYISSSRANMYSIKCVLLLLCIFLVERGKNLINNQQFVDCNNQLKISFDYTVFIIIILLFFVHHEYAIDILRIFFFLTFSFISLKFKINE